MMSFVKDFFSEVKDTLKSTYKYWRFFIVVSLFLFSSFFQSIPIYIFNINTSYLSNNLKCLLTLFSNGTLLIFCIILYFKDIKKQFISLKDMKKQKRAIILDTSFRYWLIGLVIMIASNFIIGKLGIIASANDSSVRSMLNASPILACLSIIFVAPFIEEIVFRMAFKDILNRKWLFILTSGIIFGSMHVVFSISSIYELLYLIPYCSLGIAFAVIYQDSDNIFFSCLMHVIHNGLTALTAFLLAGVILC